MATRKQASSKKGKATKKKTSKSTKRAPPKREKRETAVIVRRNASVMRTRDTRATKKAEAEAEAAERAPLAERVQNLGGSHFASTVGAGVAGSALAVAMVGKGWIGPKSSAGVLMGAGAVSMAAGWWFDADHLMTAGAGLTAAGTFSIANQFSVDAYEAIEKRAEEKRAEREARKAAEERQKRLADARALIAEEEGKGKSRQRNARRIVILDRDGRPIADVADLAA